MVISHLVAASENNVIGKHNQIPWNLPNDLKFFKNKSWGMPVIMGRNTYESLEKPLPGRISKWWWMRLIQPALFMFLHY